MTYDKKKRRLPSWYNAPTSPVYRKEPWVTIIIRKAHYAMLREMAEYKGISVAGVAMEAIEVEFNRMLREIDPVAENFTYAPPPLKRQSPRKKRVRKITRKKSIDEILADLEAQIHPPLQERPPKRPPPVHGKEDEDNGVEEPTPEETPAEESTPRRAKIYVPRF
jgi:hypothetical protein